MTNARRLLPVAVLLLLATAVAACDAIPFTGTDIFSDEGIVGWVSFFEDARPTDDTGICWFIRTPEDRFETTNLPDEFKVDGLRVRFEAWVRDDLAGACQIGPIIELRWIERVEIERVVEADQGDSVSDPAPGS